MGWQSHTPSPPYDRHLKEVTHLPLPPLTPTFGLPFSLSHSPSTITHFTLHFRLSLYSKESLLSSLPLAQRRSRHLSFTPSPSSTQPPLPLEAHGRSKKERKPKLCSTHTCVTLFVGKRVFPPSSSSSLLVQTILISLSHFLLYNFLVKKCCSKIFHPHRRRLSAAAVTAVAIITIIADHSLHLLHFITLKVGLPQLLEHIQHAWHIDTRISDS